MNDKPTEIPIYIATAFADGLTLAARCAADLAAHGLTVPTDAQWWRWPECALPVESDYVQGLRGKTMVYRAETEIARCGRLLVLLTDGCGPDLGAQVKYAQIAGLPIYWIDYGATSVPNILRFGVRVANLEELAKATGART